MKDKKYISENYSSNSWQAVIFREFEAVLTSKSRPFPCIFGVAGFTSNQLRFDFLDQLSAKHVSPILSNYLKESRDIGINTSLVLFSKPSPIDTIENYENKFWELLSELAKIDNHTWPEKIPKELDHSKWEFCFEGEPMFVVCNTPAHINRQSRRSSTYMITFQPRWVFDDILGDPETAKRSIAKVRRRLKPYDIIPPSPHLGLYGDKDNREYKQYFLKEDNNEVSCPYHTLEKLEEEIF